MTSLSSNDFEDSFEIIEPPEIVQKCPSIKYEQDLVSKQLGDEERIEDCVVKCEFHLPVRLDDLVVFSTLFDFALSSFALGFFVHAGDPLFIPVSLASALITLLTIFSFKTDELKLYLKSYFLMITVRYSICVMSIHQQILIVLLTLIATSHAFLIGYCIHKWFRTTQQVVGQERRLARATALKIEANQSASHMVDNLLIFSILLDFSFSSFALGFFYNQGNLQLTTVFLASSLITLLLCVKMPDKLFKRCLQYYLLIIIVRYCICVQSIPQQSIVILLTIVTIAHASLIGYYINKKLMEKLQSRYDIQKIFDWSTLADFACSLFAAGFFVTSNQLFAGVFFASAGVAILTLIEWKETKRNLRLYFFSVTARYGIFLPSIHSHPLAILATLVTVAHAGLIYCYIEHRRQKAIEDRTEVDPDDVKAQTTMEIERAETFKQRLETLEQLELLNGWNVVELCRLSIKLEICLSLFFLGVFASSRFSIESRVLGSLFCIFSTLFHYRILPMFKRRFIPAIRFHYCLIVIPRLLFITFNSSHLLFSYWSFIVVIELARVTLAHHCVRIFKKTRDHIDSFVLADMRKVFTNAEIKSICSFTRNGNRKKIVGLFPSFLSARRSIS